MFNATVVNSLFIRIITSHSKDKRPTEARQWAVQSGAPYDHIFWYYLYNVTKVFMCYVGRASSCS